MDGGGRRMPSLRSVPRVGLGVGGGALRGGCEVVEGAGDGVDRGGDGWEAGAPPGAEAADDVGGVDAEVSEGGGGETGLVALLADEDDASAEDGELGVAVRR